MLHGIKSLNPTTKNETAVDLLVGCHDRIRNFTSVVRKLAHAEGSTLEEISTAASSAHRYFTVSLPLHEADEEESLRPRLRENGSAEIVAALNAMTHQHHGIDDLVERLIPILVLLSSNPAKLPEVHGEMCSLSKALDEVFRGHLDLEETVLFPAVSNRLSPVEQGAMLAEMKQRRKQG
ncbi:Hemerythrin HHE cation binding protein [Candidatus Koribacter versatilis Ellin345]|uniref:Hemerythrin HHE cation binding protein n=1 Tax=Koribacter versatilis (strain Ellin345) TaxID=204669 RepID=Q1IU98_KORVE|nr:hemerythrin domain-containing protein [Candidatus Koribacter versatilis]ABF39552.1 Hemerythrin HHE cation binding protein [Candidatus Koribacter versatilis Ellin345]